MNPQCLRWFLCAAAVAVVQIHFGRATAAPVGMGHQPRPAPWVTHFWEDGTPLNAWNQDGDANNWRLGTTEGIEANNPFWAGAARNAWLADPWSAANNPVLAVDTGLLAPSGDLFDWISTAFADTVNQPAFPWYIHFDAGFFYDAPAPFVWCQAIITPNAWFWNRYSEPAGKGWTGWKHLGVDWHEFPIEVGNWNVFAGVWMPGLTATTVLFDNLLVEEDPPGVPTIPSPPITGPGTTGPGDGPENIVPEASSLLVWLLLSLLGTLLGWRQVVPLTQRRRGSASAGDDRAPTGP